MAKCYNSRITYVEVLRMTQVVYDKETKEVILYIKDGVAVLPSNWDILTFGDDNEPVMYASDSGYMNIVPHAMITTMHQEKEDEYDEE